MRRSVLAFALATVSVATLGGTAACAVTPAVGDGHINGDWAIFSTPTVPTPRAETCRTATGDLTVEWEMSLFATTPVPCAERHLTETYFVGAFTGESAALTTPPLLGDGAFREAFESCAGSAKSFLGEIWQRAAVAIVPVLPTETQWQGGARWYRCEMLRVADADEKVVAVTGSLKDGLRGTKPYALTCAKDSGQTEDAVDAIVYLPCSTPHTAELSGVYVAPDTPYPGDEKVNDAAMNACERLARTYLGLSESAFNNRTTVAWLAWGADEGRWAAGDRSFRCYVGTYDRKKLIKGSIKGLGGSPLPS